MKESEVRKLLGETLLEIYHLAQSRSMFVYQAIQQVGEDMLDSVLLCEIFGIPAPDDTDSHPIVSFVFVGRRVPRAGDFLKLPRDDGGFYRVQSGDLVGDTPERDIYTRVERQAAIES